MSDPTPLDLSKPAPAALPPRASEPTTLETLRHPLRTLRPWTRHSLVLLVSGAVYVGIGASYVLAEPSATREVALRVALLWVPFPVWGVIFALVGLMAIVSSRWPPTSETWGYTAMTGISAAWAAFYLFGIFAGAPAQNSSAVCVWTLIAFLWWAISGLLSPPTKTKGSSA